MASDPGHQWWPGLVITGDQDIANQHYRRGALCKLWGPHISLCQIHYCIVHLTHKFCYSNVRQATIFKNFFRYQGEFHIISYIWLQQISWSIQSLHFIPLTHWFLCQYLLIKHLQWLDTWPVPSHYLNLFLITIYFITDFTWPVPRHSDLLHGSVFHYQTLCHCVPAVQLVKICSPIRSYSC